VRSITAFRKDDSSTPIDFDALPAADLDVAGLYNNKQVSQEASAALRNGPAQHPGRRLFPRRKRRHAVRRSSVHDGPGFSAFTSASVDTETFAVFGDATFDLTEQISFSGGAPLHLG
jgi:iron complex outermembrane receptor protein